MYIRFTSTEIIEGYSQFNLNIEHIGWVVGRWTCSWNRINETEITNYKPYRFIKIQPSDLETICCYYWILISVLHLKNNEQLLEYILISNEEAYLRAPNTITFYSFKCLILGLLWMRFHWVETVNDSNN